MNFSTLSSFSYHFSCNQAAWCGKEYVPYYFSIKFQGHTGWKIDDLNRIWVQLLGQSQLSNSSDLPCCILILEFGYISSPFLCGQKSGWIWFINYCHSWNYYSSLNSLPLFSCWKKDLAYCRDLVWNVQVEIYHTQHQILSLLSMEIQDFIQEVTQRAHKQSLQFCVDCTGLGLTML